MTIRKGVGLQLLHILSLLILASQCTPSLSPLQESQQAGQRRVGLVYYSERPHSDSSLMGGLYLLDLKTNKERYLTPGIDVWKEGSNVRPSTDGKLVFSSGALFEESELYSVDLAGHMERLTDNFVEDIWADWAPNGKRVAFYSRLRDDGVRDLYLMDANGSNVQRVLDDEAVVGIHFAWSPDSEKLAVIALPLEQLDFDVQEQEARTLHIIDVRTRKTLLSLSDGRIRSYPNWSSDSRKLTYVSNPVTHQHVPLYTKLWILDLQTGEERTIAEFETITDPHWAPHADIIAFSGGTLTTSKAMNVYLAKSDGSGLEQLTNDKLLAVGSWSPDGDKLAITSVGVTPNEDSEIYVLDVESRSLEQVTDNEVLDAAPAWVELDE